MFKLHLVHFLLCIHFANGAPEGYLPIISCLEESNIPQDYPNTSNFSQDSLDYNLRLNFTPIAIAVPSTVPQVQAAVNCAAKLGIKVNPKSGGHSYAGHSVGGEDGHLVVDLKYFRETKVDSATNVATIGPGARLGNIALDLYAQGERAMAHGICPGVGIGGHVLHGGQGYSSHTYGLLLDFLVSAEVVLANGSVATASNTSNPDLFWALRGAGMSFGIVTSMEFRTIPAPPENILFYYPYLWNQTQAHAGWDAWQAYCGGETTPIIPPAMNVRWVIVDGDDGLLLFLLEGAFHGSIEDFDLSIAPLIDVLDEIGGFQGNVTGVVGWLDALLYANSNGLYSNWDNNQTLETPLNYTAHATFFAKSLMTRNLSPAGVDAWINRLYATGPTSPTGWYFIVAAQGGPTSYVPTVPADSTSYAHRHSIYEWQLVAQTNSPPFNDAGITWLNPFVSDIEAAESNLTLGMYYNYADPTLSKEEAHERYWLQHYGRLAEIKKSVDPDLVFLNPQTVGN
ncbi:FAD-binding domain-containing protein [Mollisia scopiformis]|uniref:FAD-binding domain-containing protein n=1 Tax=Mollisia scopiformis TaxID=149040 RepID=A0A132BB20_MOLSC|nr:FAD-binding domain-containing protein [Mollisia scopiformis]KUJ09586.1 FAD-binding domain-containing protein [Mollisia scopiformis]